ncbi:hypothetical protein E4L96_14010 [Massilia arenosa]|uniref:Uncharacterized protein n=1 Tax=Zemynaea arenosa TaxID=2561931 RepID=A0A4Y9SD82_9BURK|nr:hypothetical protein [Massilia arenosa]TFW17773.1 hypothetical protein E4L96_14010 [Massilia arenosa]
MSDVNTAKLNDMMSGALDSVLDKHRSEIFQIAGKSGDATRTVLANESVMRTVAEYCYAALPWPIRMAVKQPVFVDFVMARRERIVDKLTRSAATS